MQQLKLAYTKKQASFETTLSVRTIDYLIAKGELRARKVCRRVLIPGTELLRMIQRGTGAIKSSEH